MHETLTELISAPLDIGWKVLTFLTLLSVLDMSRQLLRRTRHLMP